MKKISLFLILLLLVCSCAVENKSLDKNKNILDNSNELIYKEDTIRWTDEKAIIISNNACKVLFEDVYLTFYASEGKEYSLDEVKAFEQADSSLYNEMMQNLSERHNNYTLLYIKAPFIVYKDEYYFDVGAHPVGGEELICYSLLTDSIIKTLDIAYDTDDQYELDYKKALATMVNFIDEQTFEGKKMQEEMEKLSGTFSDNGERVAYFDKFISCSEICGKTKEVCKEHISQKRSFSIYGSGPDGFRAYDFTFDTIKNKFYTYTSAMGKLKASKYETTKFYISKEKVFDNNYITFRDDNNKLRDVLKEVDPIVHGDKMLVQHSFSGEYRSAKTKNKVFFHEKEFIIEGWDLGSEYRFIYNIYDRRESVIKTNKTKLYYRFNYNGSINFYEGIEGDQWSSGATLLDSLIPTKHIYKKSNCIYNFTQNEFLLDVNFTNYSHLDLHIMLNELLARNGYVFKNKAWDNFFSLFKWYVPNKNLDNTNGISTEYSFADVSCLKTEIERYNFKKIVQYLYANNQAWMEGYWEMIMDRDIIKLTEELKVENE